MVYSVWLEQRKDSTMPTKAAVRKKTKHPELHFHPYERVVISSVSPSVDCGQYPAKRCIGDRITICANIFAEGHDVVAGCMEYRHESESAWQHLALNFYENDRWSASFRADKLGTYIFVLKGWVDNFSTWLQQFKKREDSKDIELDLVIGLNMLRQAKEYANDAASQRLDVFYSGLKQCKDTKKLMSTLEDAELSELMYRFGPRLHVACSHEYTVIVERVKARFSAWYEIFPRSRFGQKDAGNFKSMLEKLHYIKELGFDVVYLPPIHPIGLTNRKGKNNNLKASYDDPGSPWAIGNSSGGHMSIHPDLGDLHDFRKLIAKAHELNMEIALDFALQCSPDHPYLKEHPEWFKIKPDGSLQYAENPPKKYQDIYPLNFESPDWYPLWKECKKILQFWIKQGIKIFRVDNPHTKPFIFWEWLIAEIKKKDPDVIFLAEAFTRPSIMYHLAKIGFSQSYTYFTWRNTKQELIDYFEELSQPPICEFFRPNLWPNTPDILHEYLQKGDVPAFIIRLILAATLSPSYGIYGPAYELSVHEPLMKGSEEYFDSEKYEIKYWQQPIQTKVRDVISKINQVRAQHPALQTMANLKFHPTDNPQLLCYSKHSADFSNVILVVVNLDYQYTQAGWVEIRKHLLGIKTDHYIVKDLLNDTQYHWQGDRNFVELNPHHIPAHVFEVKEFRHA